MNILVVIYIKLMEYLETFLTANGKNVGNIFDRLFAILTSQIRQLKTVQFIHLKSNYPYGLEVDPRGYLSTDYSRLYMAPIKNNV